jgi:predicted glycosyltransferase
MRTTRRDRRILLYSHDSFGLGHLRRCRTIAAALAAADRDVSVLIVSGSPVVERFDFPDRVRFIQIPGVVKLKDGAYTPIDARADLSLTMKLRAAAIRDAAARFDPDLFLVDKEPLGLRGEIRDTLGALRARGCRCVLGLRDVLDAPDALAREWARKGAIAALHALYDDIWVYGDPRLCDPLDGLGLTPDIRRKRHFTGYLRRPLPNGETRRTLPQDARRITGGRFLLVTAGGGGDGETLFDAVLAAYESGDAPPHPALLVFGPFLPAHWRDGFRARAAALPNVAAIDFDAHVERLMADAAGVVAMAGYNTFCEILSFDKPALLWPRTAPRREQLIRARRAEARGLAAMIDPARTPDANAMATALRTLPDQTPPSAHMPAGLLDGLDAVVRLARDARRPAARPLAAVGS